MGVDVEQEERNAGRGQSIGEEWNMLPLFPSCLT